MNRDQARLEILERSKEYFTPDNSGKGYICPICSSGSGANGTGITTKDGIHFTCWAGAGASCFKNADIFEIVGIERGLTSFPQQLEYLAEYFHIHLDPLQERRTTAREDFAIPIDQSETRAATAPEPVEKQTEPPIDYTDFFLQANKHIQDTDYHRGLSLDTLNRLETPKGTGAGTGYPAAYHTHQQRKLPCKGHTPRRSDTRASRKIYKAQSGQSSPIQPESP